VSRDGRRFVAGIIVVLGYGAFLVYAFPGFMTIDSAQQLTEARTGVVGDWHPPAMARLWSVVELVVAGAPIMLVLQSGAFLAGAALLYRRVFEPIAAAVAAVLTLCWPPLVAPMAVIWKDSQMAGYLLLGFALVLEERRRKWLGVALLALATAMRSNAAAATLPLVVLGFSSQHARSRWQRTAIAFCVWVATTIAAFATNRVLTTAPSHAWHTSICTSDIVGVLEFSRKYSDAELLPIFDGTPLVLHEKLFINARKFYTPITWWRVVNGPDRMFAWPNTDEEDAALTRAWWTLVRHNPLAYLDHRWHVFREVLAMTSGPPFDPVSHERVPASFAASLQLETESRASQDAIGNWLMSVAVNTVWFRAWLYFGLALLFLPLAWRYRDIAALFASGLVYELTFYPFAPSPDTRYSHWLMTATVTATVQLVGRRMTRIEPRQHREHQPE
jgi:hypothetical protein